MSGPVPPVRPPLSSYKLATGVSIRPGTESMSTLLATALFHAPALVALAIVFLQLRRQTYWPVLAFTLGSPAPLWWSWLSWGTYAAILTPIVSAVSYAFAFLLVWVCFRQT